MNTNLNYYRSELKSKSVARYKTIGITTELILNKDIFGKNTDIVFFLEDIYGFSYKEYIIKSRTLIIARSARDIYKMEKKEYEYSRRKLYNFVNDCLSHESNNIKPNNSDFGKWMDGIKDADS